MSLLLALLDREHPEKCPGCGVPRKTRQEKLSEAVTQDVRYYEHLPTCEAAKNASA